MGKWFIIVVLLVSVGCAKKPPLQEMAEARSAIETVRHMSVTESVSRQLGQAEDALKEASEAISQKRYGKARSKALEAKRDAQEAARIQRNQHE